MGLEVMKAAELVMVDLRCLFNLPMVAPIVDELAMNTPARSRSESSILMKIPEVGRYQVMSIPTMLFKNGQVVEKLVGARPKAIQGND